MSAIKNQLIEYIEAYAVAKSTNNNLLVTLIAGALRQLVDSLDIKEVVGKKAPLPSGELPGGDDFTTPEVTRQTRSSKRSA